jgi:hypothetical protein
MKKIQTLFVRDYDNDGRVINQVTPGAEWVTNGEGLATRKWDGLAILISDGVIYKRYDAKAFTIDNKTGEKRTYDRKPPEGFIPLQDFDPITGHMPGWVPCKLPEDKLAIEIYKSNPENYPDGTYELCGPKIGTRHGANPEGLTDNGLYRHGTPEYPDFPRTFEAIREALMDADIEGIVWHNNGDMVKIKAADFGLKR